MSAEKQTSEKQKFAKRLHDVLDEAGFPENEPDRQKAVGKLLNVDPVKVESWLAGAAYPKTSILVKLARYVRVRSNWLLSGIGSKHLDLEEEEAYISRVKSQLEKTAADNKQLKNSGSVNNDENILTRDALEVAHAFMRLPYSQQMPIHTLILELAKNKQV